MSLRNMLTTRNVGTFDRTVRTVPAIAVAYSWTEGLLSGPFAIVAAVVAFILLFTSILGSCSIYYMLGLSSCRTGK